MTASPQEAEDCVQESCLRAWRRLDEVRDDLALKPWLYSIATRVCLDALRGRQRRATVHNDFESAGEMWVEPMAGPHDILESRESIRLAFVSLLQTLPPKARAALILHEVLDWTAAEVAQALDTTLPAARSLIQRSRGKLDRPPPLAPQPVQSEVLAQYVAAWEARDLEAFGRLLRHDAVYVMPPRRQVYLGADAITTFFAGIWPLHDRFRMSPIVLNDQAAAVFYVPDGDGWRPHSLHLPDISDDGIARLTLYIPPLGPELFQALGLESVLS